MPSVDESPSKAILVTPAGLVTAVLAVSQTGRTELIVRVAFHAPCHEFTGDVF